MKKLMIAMLCLMLVLPLHAFADNTESQNQGQTQSENQNQNESGSENSGQTGSENSGQTGSENSGQSGSENSGQSGGENSGQTGSENSGQTGSENSGQTGSENSGQTGSENSGQTGSENSGQTGSENSGQSGGQTPGQTETQPSQPSDHTHVWDVSYTVAATCTEEGATAYGCSACGAISVEVLPAAGHKFSSQWTKKAKGHWHACSVCGAESDFGKHYPGPAATEEKAQICLTCGYTLTAKLGHTHKYETTYTSDETGHWYACSGCDEQKDFSGHSYDDGCDADCNDCGYRTVTAHSYSGTWSSDETGHWDVCTICQEESPVEPHIPGPEATETEAQTCTACSFEITPALAPTEHVHVGEGSWLTDAENHWKLCACAEETEKQPHNWDEGEKQEDATILYTCEDCGTTRTEGEPETVSGVNPLIWIGLAVAVLLGGAVVILILLITRLRKGGKYGK